MKLLRVTAANFKNCQDDFTIDFVANSKKVSQFGEDWGYQGMYG